MMSRTLISNIKVHLQTWVSQDDFEQASANKLIVRTVIQYKLYFELRQHLSSPPCFYAI